MFTDRMVLIFILRDIKDLTSHGLEEPLERGLD